MDDLIQITNERNAALRELAAYKQAFHDVRQDAQDALDESASGELETWAMAVETMNVFERRVGELMAAIDAALAANTRVNASREAASR